MRSKVERVMSEQVVVFDFGGVVQELEDDAIIHELAARCHADLADIKEYWKRIIGQVQIGAITESEFVAGIVRDGEERLVREARQIFTAPFRGGSRLYPDVVALLDELRAEHRELAVFSNTVPSHAVLNRRRGNYRWFGKNVFLSFQMKTRKPLLESYQALVRDLGRPAASLLIIDDDPENVEAARDAGLRGVRHDSARDVIGALRAAIGC